MTKTFFLTFAFALTLISCSVEPDFSANKSERQKLIDTLIRQFNEMGENITRDQAEKFLDEFEKLRKEHGDSVTYFSGIYLGFGKPAKDTAELRRINGKN